MMRTILISVVSSVLAISLGACQRENSAEPAKPSNPASSIDQASRQAVDAVKTPMDKARGVEGTFEKAAEQTADKVQETAQ